MNTKHTLIASVLAAIGASICCVAPLVLLAFGIGGAWISTLTQFEPLRPIFVGLTLVLLTLAWRKLYRAPAACELGKPCADASVQRRQRLIFWSVAAPLMALLVFPWFAPFFY